MAREAARFNRVGIGLNSCSINAFAQGMNGGLIVAGCQAQAPTDETGRSSKVDGK